MLAHGVDPYLPIRQQWYSTARVVQQQARNIGAILGNFRHVCRSRQTGSDGGLITVKDDSIVATLSAVNGSVSFHGDDPSLPVRFISGSGQLWWVPCVRCRVSM